ncbi:MAG: oligoendopeptidase F [Parachlamydiaceae bacterium]|nr:oligoendopeptidase F [Parachlamydiaceae bacterium]
MTKARNEVELSDKWNVEALYPNMDEWQRDFDKTVCENQKPRWPELSEFQGKLADPIQMKKALEQLLSLDRHLTKLYTYAHLRHDEDIVEDLHKTAFKRMTAVIQDFQQETAWFDPELLAFSDQQIAALLSSPILSDYRFHLEKTIRVKKHTLSADQERLMALAGQPLQASYRAFSAINDADFKFGKVLDEQGNPHELTHGTYGLYLRGKDRTLRKNTYIQMHGVYRDYENTLCETLTGQVQGHVFNARARNYSSSLDAALFPKNIDLDVYHALIKAVHDRMPALHKYMDLRKKLLGLERLHLYDMSVPLVANLDIMMPYEEAEDVIIGSVAPLGEEYQKTLKEGLKTQRWADRYENKNKRSGAYSSGCYDSMPYILMNYKDLLRDVFTLSHEVGHSMHSYLSHKYQPYHYGDYSIFVAEVASTFNEDLLMRVLLNRAKSKEEKIYLLTQKIDDIRGTLFRQTMFAEFELFVHEKVENNEPLTPNLLKTETRRLNQLYFGPNVELDAESDSEWSRIPHFYYNYYVYQYATGISAALALADRVVDGGVKERDAYLSFLKGGSSKYPIDMLEMAGVNMRTPQPVIAAIQKFEKLVDQLEKLALE